MNIVRTRMMGLCTLRKYLLALLACTFAAVGAWATGADEEAAAERIMVTDPTTGAEILAPQYGGTLIAGFSDQPEGTDPSVANHWAGFLLSGVNEKLGMGDWGIDRSVYAYETELVADVAFAGALAESWQMPDDTTIVFNIRQGVHWHDKEPMNGRELTASDIEYNYHRLMGLGSGFTEPPGYTLELPSVPVESVTATGDYTVEFKLSAPSLTALRTIIDDALAYMLPPEVVRDKGDVNDWRDVVGTGPFELVDWVDSSSITWVKNPNYWGVDEKFPDNRLPYVDEVLGLIIPEETTRLSALRTGKVDFLGHGSIGDIRNLETATNLAETNPEVNLWPWFFRSNQCWAFNLTAPPFDDIRVRTAMQLALNIDEVHEDFFEGRSLPTPFGVIGMGWPGYFAPFDEWPQELQEEYTYNPERAEELLDEAGYPRGADGIRFTTSADHWTTMVEWSELSAAYWKEIGVEVTLNPVSGPEHVARVQDKSYGGLVTTIAGAPYHPIMSLGWFETTNQWNRQGVDDPEYNAIFQAAVDATTAEELKEWAIAGDMYALERHWFTWGPLAPLFQASQPWVVGYNGEVTLGGMNYGGIIWSRLWIDQEKKKEMGY